MVSEARKIQLIEGVLKVTNDDTFKKLEAVLSHSKKAKEKKGGSAHDFLGLWSSKDAALIEKAIDESCGQIHEDDWK